MKKRQFITAVLSVVLGCSASAAVAKPSAQEILAASDAIRNPDHPFGLTTTLTEYRDGKQTDVSTLAVYSRADKESGQFSSLIRFIAPARDANKLMLKTGNDLWFYDPSNKASIRISPQQRLLGQAANGDVVTFNLAKDYHATLSGEEEVLDADRQKRNSYKLTLAATKPDVTYHHIEAWIDSANNRPVKARFYSESNRLLKTAYYRQYENQLGAERPTETVIIDGLDPKWVTVLRFTNWAVRDVPEAWLQRDYLPRFKPQ
ncbi:outer membrane lipoprotein-sorting protein [Janthinobacterium sp. PC23-8]|uniref:outer membrane lipoprotein-sorting protein n=1 Tax=Janthinobacterium sp. PC23-8 TaxID=2012679 RepID=UPI000B95DFE7|nr:outer membrane lipoprotein-sorting protein [Janthinobacterium sp. PC23-8]OYO28771.1 outer membrane lipoprotein-sorting protein [Janthinobacterium sp. PC23-8]